MSNAGPKLTKDRDEVILKFKELIDKANAACEVFKQLGVVPSPATCISNFE